MICADWGRGNGEKMRLGLGLMFDLRWARRGNEIGMEISADLGRKGFNFDHALGENFVCFLYATLQVDGD